MTGRRGHGEGAVYRRADGLWVGAVDLGRDPTTGKRRRKVVKARTKAAVLAKLDTVRHQVATGLPVPNGTLTTGDYLDAWLRDVLPGTVKNSTVENYRVVVETYIKPHVGTVPLAKLGPLHVDRMLRALDTAGRSPRTRQYARAVLRRALRHAEQRGMVVRNAAALVDGPRTAAAKLDDALTADEARAVLDTSAAWSRRNAAGNTVATPHRLHALAVVVLRLGLRKGEALALRWSDVDLDAGTLTVAGTLKRTGGRLVIDRPKTDAAHRTVPLVGDTLDALKAHRKAQAAERLASPPVDTDATVPDLVFATELGEPLDPRNVLRWWHDLTERAGIGRRRMHAARHTTATLLLDAGVPLEVVSAVLGHASLAITADVYARVTADAKRRALESLAL